MARCAYGMPREHPEDLRVRRTILRVLLLLLYNVVCIFLGGPRSIRDDPEEKTTMAVAVHGPLASHPPLSPATRLRRR